MKLSELKKKEILSSNGSSRIVYSTNDPNLVLKETSRKMIGKALKTLDEFGKILKNKETIKLEREFVTYQINKIIWANHFEKKYSKRLENFVFQTLGSNSTNEIIIQERGEPLKQEFSPKLGKSTIIRRSDGHALEAKPSYKWDKESQRVKICDYGGIINFSKFILQDYKSKYGVDFRKWNGLPTALFFIHHLDLLEELLDELTITELEARRN